MRSLCLGPYKGARGRGVRSHVRGAFAIAAALAVCGWSTVAFGAVSSQSEFDSVACGSPGHCVAVGFFLARDGEHTFAQSLSPRGGRIMSTPSPGNAPQLNSVSCLAAGSCVAVGNGSKGVLAERLAGGHWRVSPASDPGPSAALTGVSCVSANWCVAVGTTASGTGLLSETFNGAKWSMLPSPALPADTRLAEVAVSCASSTFCMMVGADVESGGGTPSFKALAAVFDGSSWALTPVPAAGKQPTLSGVSCPASGVCVAVGSSDPQKGAGAPALAERYADGVWSQMSDPPAAGAYPVGVTCIAVASCMAVGGRASGAFAERLTGTSWAAVPTASPGEQPLLSAVSCSSARSCVAVGSYEGGGALESTLAEQIGGPRPTQTNTPDETIG